MNIHDLLQTMADRKLTLGTVESMTGGDFASAITAIPGASHVYKGGIVAYSKEVKSNVVGLDPAIIEKYDVVSAQVARELAIGGMRALGVDICVSVTGNAGPDAEEGKAKVGDFFLGLAYKNSVYVLPVHFEGDRAQIRKNAVLTMTSFVASLFQNRAEESPKK